MGVLAERLAYLATRYGSDAAAWQHEIHAVAALEESDAREALERFHALKRRFAEFRRAQLLRELRSFAFVRDVPSTEAGGYETKEIEADIRAATRALGLARAIQRAQEEEADARAGLRLRRLALEDARAAHASWDALAPLAREAESRRRVVAREARLDRRLAEAQRRAGKLARAVALPDAGLDAGPMDAALDDAETRLDRAETLEDAWRAALAPLKAPEVATYRHDSKRSLEREAQARLEAGDLSALRALLPRAEALRKEAAALASQAARSRRTGSAPPPRERRSSDPMDGYG
ncbi:MAG TPA: hypothetical protein VM370_05295 [Candidatus Thermoplasmatota archaeon]|nr:hypothetical protein [Candidatus Thermoplasmatota archaeon]